MQHHAGSSAVLLPWQACVWCAAWETWGASLWHAAAKQQQLLPMLLLGNICASSVQQMVCIVGCWWSVVFWRMCKVVEGG